MWLCVGFAIQLTWYSIPTAQPQSRRRLASSVLSEMGMVLVTPRGKPLDISAIRV
ncbi:hypothetical protein GQ53DRAFT_742797 [Thozetella sp. PMI_491]|nr:hypothetical protein GQ53DRAFT_742797 [Thozetella sp. PMI_491]